jgi:hypothetical protein
MIEGMNLNYMKKTIIKYWKMDVLEMKKWCGMDRWGDVSNASTRFIVDKTWSL